MTTSSPFELDPNAAQLAAILADADARGETASPALLAQDDDHDPNQDTGALTIGAVARAGLQLSAAHNQSDLETLRARGKVTFSPAEVKVMMDRAAQRGAAAAPRPVPKPAGAPRIVLPQNFVKAAQTEERLFKKWADKKAPFSATTGGYLYFVGEALFKVSGDPKRGLAVLDTSKEIRLFHVRRGEQNALMGEPENVPLWQTNLEKPPTKGSAPDIDYHVLAVSLAYKGMRIAYPQPLVDKAITAVPALGGLAPALRGRAWLADDGVFTPAEFYNEQTGDNDLFEQFKRSGRLYFHWQQKRTGNNKSREIEIAELSRLSPDRPFILRETSGGEPVTEDGGYVFNANPDDERGEFHASIAIDAPVYYGLTGVDIGTGTPELPTLIGLYFGLTLHINAFFEV